MATNKVSIAGKEFELTFMLRDKRDIETKLGKYLNAAMWSGLSNDLNVILATGLSRKHKDMATPLAVEERLQKHVDKGLDLMDVHRAVNRAIFDSHIMGIVPPDEITRLFREFFGEEAPKEQAAAVEPAG